MLNKIVFVKNVFKKKEVHYLIQLINYLDLLVNNFNCLKNSVLDLYYYLVKKQKDGQIIVRIKIHLEKNKLSKLEAKEN